MARIGGASMRNEIRTAVYDSTLRIEACRFAGLGPVLLRILPLCLPIS